MLEVYFVMDIMNGKVVHAVSGEREKYRQIDESSVICDSSGVIDVFKTIQPFNTYIADLDRIQGTGRNDEYVKRIAGETKLILDGGFETTEDVQEIDFPFTPVFGTETSHPSVLENHPGAFVSIDMKMGCVISRHFPESLDEILDLLNSYPLQGVILLQLEKVGTEGGFMSRALTRIMDKSSNPVYLGGGIRGMEDLIKLESIGCAGALVSTAVHRGKIDLEIIRRGYM